MKVAMKISSVSKRRESEFPPTGLSVISQLVSRAWGNPQGNPKQNTRSYRNASCHLFDIAPLRGAVDLNMPFSIDIAPLRGAVDLNIPFSIDIAPLRGAVDLNMPFSIDISPLRGGEIV